MIELSVSFLFLILFFKKIQFYLNVSFLRVYALSERFY